MKSKAEKLEILLLLILGLSIAYIINLYFEILDTISK